MRKINWLVVHCSATPQTTTVESIQRYWREVLGWGNPGYAKIIEASGKVHILAPDEAVTNGVKGHNKNSLHVCYIGGIDSNKKELDNRTPAQKDALLRILSDWKEKYPSARIVGHRDFLKPGVNWKACPSFNAIEQYKNVW